MNSNYICYLKLKQQKLTLLFTHSRALNLGCNNRQEHFNGSFHVHLIAAQIVSVV